LRKERIENKTIEDIPNMGLCTGCGTCAGMCPNSSIEMTRNSNGTYTPILDKEKCNQCGICFNVCPGLFIDIDKYNLEIFNEKPKNFFLGNYKNCYLGHSLDEKIRWNSSSGGLITMLLIFALQEGIISGALVTRMSRKKPLEPEAFIAKTKKEIISASGSKYCPVAANVIIKKIRNERGKFAVVGLPCHIHGVRKAELFDTELKEKIVLHLGLFCGHTPNFLGNEFLFKRLNILKNDIAKITYRGRGWPGSMTIELRDGSRMSIPFLDYYITLGSPFFVPMRCMLCSDQSNELADISFGDAWLPDLKNKQIGESIAVSRTEIGEEILQKAKSKVIKIAKIDCNKVILSQRRKLYSKKKNLAARIRIWKILGKKIPIYDCRLQRPPNLSYLDAILRYLVIYVSLKPPVRNSLIFRTPFLLPRVYYFFHEIFVRN